MDKAIFIVGWFLFGLFLGWIITHFFDVD